MSTTSRWLSLALSAPFFIISACGEDSDDPFRPETGEVTLDLTDPAQAEWFMANTQSFHWLDNDHADEYVYYEWRQELGVCAAVGKRHTGFEFAELSPYFENAENIWGTGVPISPRVPTDATREKCDTCTGITIPYMSPKRITMTVSSVNITEENVAEMFTDSPNIQADLLRSSPQSRGFIGFLNHIPAVETEDGNVVPQFSAAKSYEYMYIRPANGDDTPGDYAGSTNSTVQYGAMFYEWFITRTQAFDQEVDGAGNVVVLPVFEGTANTHFGDTDFSSLSVDLNTIEVLLADTDTQSFTVNGVAAVSNVTREAFDRTMSGGRTPSDEPSMSALFVGNGIYGCVQKIEVEL